MANRYGGGTEDFNKEASELAALRHEREATIAKEVLYQEELTATTGLEDKAARRQTVRRRASREAADATRRAAEVSAADAKATNLDTDAILRNTQARERQAAAARRAAIDMNRAVRGARDPLFGRAGELAERGLTSQHALRRELGIGQGRASALQSALGAGFVPGTVAATGPITRQQSARVDVERAEAQLVRATNDLRNLRRRQSATDEQRLAALVAHEQAVEARNAAKKQLQSADDEASARRENAAAARAEADRRRRSADVERGRAAGTDIVLFGDPEEQRRRLARDARRNQQRINAVRGPGITSEGGAAGNLYGMGGANARDEVRALAEAARAEGDFASAAARHKAALSVEELEGYNKAYAEHSVRAAEAAGRERETIAATRAAGVSFGTASQQMTRHGALTSEFILAATRGETTMREMGNQALVTAGKFGGWTLAASALYGAANAAHRLGDGAIQAQGGVQQLRRVISDVDSGEAQQGFADLARRFNVPIEVAADAVYRMGQRFNTLPDAMKAAEASLYSFKTGEVDVGTSTQNLLAIVNGFGLDANQLTEVFDQINQAQNQFGINIGDTEAGLAKAAGTFRNSGGDLSYLLGLFIAISRATGRSGQEIGTGLSRAAVQLRQPGNQARLAAQGVEVDPNNIQATIQSAMQAARRPGADLTAISTGLLGNQYFRLLEPVLRDQSNLDAALRDTSPEASKQSAQNELAKVLKQADERVKQLGIDLERLGVQLAQAGAFNFLGLMVEGIDTVLNTAAELLGVFNELPSGLREGVVMLGQMYVLMRLIRRFGGFDRLADTPLAPLAPQDRRLQTYAVRGLRDFRQEAFNEQERAARREFVAQSNADRARQAAERERRVLVSRERSGALVPYTPQHLEATKVADALDERAQRLQTRATEATRDLTDARAIAARAESELATVTNLSHRQIRDYLQRNNIPIPAELAVPSTRGTRTLNDGAADFRVPGDVMPTRPLGRDETLRADAAERGMSAATARRVDRVNRTILSGVERLGIVGQTLGRGGQRIAETAGRVSSRAATVTSELRAVPGQVGGVLRGIALSFGPLDLLLLAVSGFVAFIAPKLREMQQRNEEADKLLADQTLTSSVDATADRRRQLLKTANRQPTGLEAALSNAVGIGLARLSGKETPEETIRREAEAARDELALDDSIARQQAAQRARNPNGPIAGRYSSEIQKDIARVGSDVERGYLSISEAREALDKAETEINSSVRIGPKARGKRLDQLDEVRRRILSAPSDFAQRFEAMNADELRDQIDATAARIGQGGQRASGFDLRELSAAYRYLVGQQRGASTPKELQQVIRDREAFFSAFEETAKREQQEGLLLARSEGDRRGVFDHSRDTLRGMTRAARDQLRNSRQQARQLRERIQRNQDALGEVVDVPADRQPGGGVFNRATRRSSAEREVEVATRELKAAKANIEQDEQAYRDALRKRKLALAGLDEEAFSDRQQGRQIDLALAQSRTSNPVRQAQLAVESARRDTADARRTFGGTRSRQYRQALTALNEAERAQAEAIRDRALEISRLQGQIAVARAGGDEVAAARESIRLSMEARRSATTRVDRLQALLDYTEANNQLEDALRERENSRFELLASRTTDPVEQARIEVRRTRSAVQGTTGTDRNRAMADYNRARQSLRQAQVDEATENIDFNLEMGKITRDQAISQYQTLLRGHNLTKQVRRDLQRRLKQLRDESESEASGFDLDVGSLKMPTVYDVRRAYAPLRDVARASRDATRNVGADIRTNVSSLHDMRSQVTAEVNVYVNDKNAAGEVFTALDRVLRTSTRATMRSAGVG